MFLKMQVTYTIQDPFHYKTIKHLITINSKWSSTWFYTFWLKVDFGQLLTFYPTIDQSQTNHPNP